MLAFQKLPPILVFIFITARAEDSSSAASSSQSRERVGSGEVPSPGHRSLVSMGRKYTYLLSARWSVAEPFPALLLLNLRPRSQGRARLARVRRSRGVGQHETDAYQPLKQLGIRHHACWSLDVVTASGTEVRRPPSIEILKPHINWRQEHAAFTLRSYCRGAGGT